MKVKENVDYTLVENGEDRWAILSNDGVEFIIDSIHFDQSPDEERVHADVKYTIISDKKPSDPASFDDFVGMVTNDLIEQMAEGQEDNEG